MRGIYIDRVGEERYNKFGSKMIIINQYRENNITYIDICFPEYNWIKKYATYNHFKKGSVRCPYERTVCGIGYIGEGNYKIWENNKQTRCYSVWSNMIKRCYSKNKRHSAYKDCSVCKEWHCYQNFAKWYYKHYYEVKEELMHLDKDILVKGNKIYSPETCVFVPQRINELFKRNKGKRGDYPIGVIPHKRDKVLEVWCRMYNDDKSKGTYLGKFEMDQVEEAFQCYKEYKEKVIKQVADDYYSKGLIPEKLYKAMYAYQVEITD